jgi:heme/copper-type cytochrome/quinol oxidase subunit 3
VRWTDHFIPLQIGLYSLLFSAYAMLRVTAVSWPDRVQGFPWLETVLLVGAGAAFGASRFRLIASHALGLTFVVIRLVADISMMRNGATPATNVMLASWYTLAWVHAFHVFGGAAFTGWLAGPSFRMSEEDRDRWLARIEATRKYWIFVAAIWLLIVIVFYFV